MPTLATSSERRIDNFPAGDGAPILGIRYHEAQMLVLTKCLKLLCDIEPPRRDIAIGIREYARESLVSISKPFHIDETIEDQKKAIGLYLVTLLST